MKLHVKLLSFAAALMSLVTACVNEGIQEPQDAANLKLIPTLEQQAAAVEESVKDLQNLQTEFEANGVEFGLNAVETLEQHVAYLKNGGLSLEEGTLATFELQKKLGAIVGSALAELDADKYESKLKRSVNALENSVKVWAGESFNVLYPAVVAESRVKVSVAGFDSKLGKQKLYVDALLSDVEAGFRKDEKPEELKGLAASVQEALANSQKLSEGLVSLAAEVSDEYTEAVPSLLSDPTNFDGAALKEFNANAGIELAEVDNSLAGLSTRVAACESQLASILERLGALETEIGNLEELLGMIQSVTLMSEYSAEKAVAKYNMGYETTSDGYKVRVPVESIELNYVVRPASAAVALKAESLWNNGLKVFGYYANRIEQSAVNFEDFTITAVEADELTGVVSITVENSLSDDFYYKKTGAKMALSISTGKTDITSKFVEVVPKDASGTIYLERLTLSKQEVEFDEGEEYNLTAIFTPENVTNKELVWTSSNDDVVSVSGSGRITGVGVGTATVTVTSKGTDEWGRTLSATCKVKVNPAIRLMGPAYVEEGKNAELTLDFPSSMVIESKVWSTSDGSKATVSNEGVVSGVAHTYSEYTYDYSPVTVYCKINESITLSHEMKVVVPQPRQVKFNNYADDAREITVKVGQSVSLAGTILPAEASSNFRLFYESNSGVLGWVDDRTGVINGNTSVGTVKVYARVFEIDKHRRFAPGKGLTREIDVKIEPYYVTSITLPSAFELEPGATGSISAVLKSDVEGATPTYTDLTWTSSNPDVLAIDPITGEYEAKAIGSALITATAPSKSTVPGEDPAYATVGVTVTKKENKPNVGDYYYADGTWSADYNPTAGNPVIGVVFYAENPSLQDPTLPSSCINGLAVGLTEYNAPIGFISTGNTAWEINNAGHYLGNKEITNGYANTVALSNYSMGKPDDSGYGIGYAQMFRYDKKGIPGQYNVSHSELSSQWYIPSYKEMSLIRDNKNIINNKLTSIGDAVNSDAYWLSTFDVNSSTNINGVYLFDMSTGKWKTSLHAQGAAVYTTPAPVRVVLAF